MGKHERYIILLVGVGWLAVAPAFAQTPTQSLATALTSICSVIPHDQNDLGERCAEIDAAGGSAALTAASGQRLEEIPGQARVATRDTPSTGSLRWLAPRWSLFVSTDHGWLTRRSSPNEAAFQSGSNAFTAGGDRQVGANWQVGFALNRVGEALDYRNSGSTASTRFNNGLLHGSRSLGSHWSASAYLGRGSGRYDLQRDIGYSLATTDGPVVIQARAKADPQAWRRSSGVSLDGQWASHGFDLGGGLGLDISSTRIEAYSETGGAGLALSVPGRLVETRRSRLDVHFGRTMSFAHGVLQPMAQLGWRQEMGNPRRAVAVRLLQDPTQTPIRFDTEDPDRAWGEVGIGAVLTLTGGQSGFIQWRRRFAHDFLSEHALALGWRVEL